VSAHNELQQEIARTIRESQVALSRATFDGPWTLDPEAFPAPIQIVPRLRRLDRVEWACGAKRFKTEAKARAWADRFNARVSKVRVYKVPRGTGWVRDAIDALADCLTQVPAWDEMEARRRKARAEWRRPAMSGLVAWMPPFGGETFRVPVKFGVDDRADDLIQITDGATLNDPPKQIEHVMADGSKITLIADKNLKPDQYFFINANTVVGRR
jgi:hypothetical protein